MIGIGIGVPVATAIGVTSSSGPKPNLLLWSEQFDNAAWVKTTTVVTANAINDPNAELTADLLDAAAITSQVSQSVGTFTPGGTYTASVYIKDGPNNIAGESGLYISDGVTTTGSAVTSIADWTRFSFTRVISSEATELTFILIVDAETATDIYAWGAKLEVGSLSNYVRREGV